MLVTDIIIGVVGIAMAFMRGISDYRQTGIITWGWVVAGLVFLVIALRPIV